ncbi:MAG TPA: AraC family transcriptional regulator, partial [Bacteroidales bacterium]|nr:AraC family transcriptional regulator [Bacteroidales bacterium]
DEDASTPIGEIALECGFTDMGYFSRTFKQLYSMTPSQYRKRVRSGVNRYSQCTIVEHENAS